MKLAVISHKACWHSHADHQELATTGGFPAQISSLSGLFDETSLVVPVFKTAAPEHVTPITGHGIRHVALDPLPVGRRRRCFLPIWLMRNGPRIWRAIGAADAVHAIVPGDIGTFGWLGALAQRKPLFVRHAGEWQHRQTLAQYVWPWLMERTAGGRNVMIATGAGTIPPSPRNPAIDWLFSTRLSNAELEACRPHQPRKPGGPGRLLVVARLVPDKGTDIVIDSLPLLLDRYPDLHLDIAGDGPMLADLKQKAAALGLLPRIAFHGQVTPDRVIELMSQADLLCVLSATESFGKVAIEAMACGLPVIAGPVSHFPSLLKDAGIVMPERSPEALADAVIAGLSDSGRYAAMSANAVTTARQYSTEQWQNRIRQKLEAAWGPLRNA